MKITLNLYQPNFKAITLNDDEKKQVSSTLHTLKKDDLSDFQRNMLKSDVMDVFIPHIQKEADESDDPKTTKFDLNMKMFDAINSFADKKDPLGWFLSVLNGTEYKDPKPTIFDILAQKEEEERLAEEERKANPVNIYDAMLAAKAAKKAGQTSDGKPEYEMYFDYDEDKEYTKKEISDRARELHGYFGRQYRYKDVLNIVQENPYLVEYNNEDFDNYINAFSEAVGMDSSTIESGIISHPELMHYAFEQINDKADEYAKISGCRNSFCLNALIRKPVFMKKNPKLMKRDLDALNFYKQVRGKEPSRPEAIFSAGSTRNSYLETLYFLVANTDKDVMKSRIYNEKQLIKHINEHGVKPYRFTIPEDKMTNDFMEFAEDWAMDNFGEDLFEFDIVEFNKYLHVEKPRSFGSYIHKNV